MKKGISVLALLALSTAGAFAQISLSAGGGVLFDSSIGNGLKQNGEKINFNNTSFGGFIFFDATFVEFDVGFAYGKLKMRSNAGAGDAGSVTQLALSLLGKYPIETGSAVIFPLLGISYNRVLSGKDADGENYEDAGNWSQFGVLGGIGTDFTITGSVFVRAEGLLQIRFPSRFQDNLKESFHSDDARKTFGIGPLFRIAVGCRF